MCGIYGVFRVHHAAEHVIIGLHGIQHRAIDYAGIVSTDGHHFFRERGPGLARQAFSAEMIDRLHGTNALGHIRYPTVTDDVKRDNIQPIVGRWGTIPVALAHNGNITNVPELMQLLPKGALSTSMDTEVILRLLEGRVTGCIEKDLAAVCTLLSGSYALGILLPDRLIAIRDPSGNRPLSIGTLNGGYCVSSETCVFASTGATHVMDVAPGSMVVISEGGIAVTAFAKKAKRECRFEHIYYAHPASSMFGQSVMRFRISLGRALEECAPAMGADIVTPIPDSSNFIAQGFAESGRSGMLLPVIFRSHYVGRTFIAADQAKRNREVAQKFAFASEEIRGKSVVVVDDSVVRGTTLPQIVGVLRQLGARAVHVRIGSPPITHSCKYGINTPTTEELVSARLSPAEICLMVGADSLEFLPLQALENLTDEPGKFCYACMNGNYW